MVRMVFRSSAARVRSISAWKTWIHLVTDFKDQVPAVFELVDGVIVVKPAVLLLLQVEGKAKTGAIDPTLADLTQPPYSPRIGQGVCDLGQAGGVGNRSKAIALLSKVNSGPAGLTGHVFMTIQDHLTGKGRMSTDLEHHMPPVRIENMERV